MQDLAERGASKSKKNGNIDATKVDDGSAAIKGEVKMASEMGMENLHKQKAHETKGQSYLLCNRVRVYSYVPDTADLPKGITLLQITEDKWVALSLDFPYEERINTAST